MSRNTTIPNRSPFLNRWDWEWKTSLRERFSTNGRWLLLNDLLIRIAPSADFQPAATPAQSLSRIRSTGRATNGTLPQSLDLIGLDRALRFFKKLLVDHGLRDCQRFPFHAPKPN